MKGAGQITDGNNAERAEPSGSGPDKPELEFAVTIFMILFVAMLGAARHYNNWRPLDGPALSHHAADFKTTQPRKNEIQNNAIRARFENVIQRFDAIFDPVRLEARALQGFAHDRANRLVVFGHQ